MVKTQPKHLEKGVLGGFPGANWLAFNDRDAFKSVFLDIFGKIRTSVM